MADETSDTAGQAPDHGLEPGRAKRPAPTIDLAATSSATHPAAEDALASSEPSPASSPWTKASADASAESTAELPPPADEPAAVPPAAAPPPAAPISPWVIAPLSGAVAAALVIGVGWLLGWPAVQAPSAAPQLATMVDGLNGRVAGLEAKSAKPDAAVAARLDALDKAVTALRTQSDKTASALNDVKAAPRDASNGAGSSAASSAALAALTTRLDQIERANRAQDNAIAQDSSKIAAAKPVDITPLRRVIAAALLDVAVRHGDPYAAALATAKALAQNPDALKPLDAFAATGVPNPAMLDRDLLALVPKLSPLSPADAPVAGNSIVDRLQAGAAKLVRIERTDGVGTDRNAIVSRITAAALRNDYDAARRELQSLAPTDRAAAQAWLDKAAARDAALSASRQFADEAMTALATPSQ